jgi:hypothetical protein
MVHPKKLNIFWEVCGIKENMKVMVDNACPCCAFIYNHLFEILNRIIVIVLGFSFCPTVGDFAWIVGFNIITDKLFFVDLFLEILLRYFKQCNDS